MVRRGQLSAGVWIGVFVLGLVALIVGLTGIVLAAVWGEWHPGAIMGMFGAVCGGAGCIFAGLSGMRSRGSAGRSA